MPDYARPDALCVPFWKFDIRATLTALAEAAAEEVGVILVGPDPAGAREFLSAQENPAHFAVVAGAFDSPWLRDYAPIALRDGSGLRHIRPRHHVAERPNDTTLFDTILSIETEHTEARLASGNLVPGPGGLAVSTEAVLEQNGYASVEALRDDACRLGIRDWVIVPSFADDVSRHADAMVRFLGPGLCAVARRSDGQAAISDRVAAAVTGARPGIEILMLETAPGPRGFTSPLNWIQLGDRLLVPDFGDAPGLAAADRRMLGARGFDLTFVPTQTQGLGGALRCLTAAIFA